MTTAGRIVILRTSEKNNCYLEVVDVADVPSVSLHTGDEGLVWEYDGYDRGSSLGNRKELPRPIGSTRGVTHPGQMPWGGTVHGVFDTSNLSHMDRMVRKAAEVASAARTRPCDVD